MGHLSSRGGRKLSGVISAQLVPLPSPVTPLPSTGVEPRMLLNKHPAGQTPCQSRLPGEPRPPHSMSSSVRWRSIGEGELMAKLKAF